MSFRHDSTGIDPNSEPGVALMPDGWYTLKIIEAEEAVSKKGNNMIVCVCSPVNEPEYADAEIKHWVVFLPKDQKGAGMSVQFRQAIGVPWGGDDDVDADDWTGKRFSAYIVTESYTNDKGKTNRKNKISSVRSLADADAATKAVVGVSANGSSSTPRGAEIIDDDVPF